LRAIIFLDLQFVQSLEKIIMLSSCGTDWNI